ncbi:MAG TPA: glycosyltransferase family 2 protein [Acidimicrobiales bacterium]|nr:glycosyltransferase family 2 protein [Acidimicrobiales bacterium]
MTHGAVFVVGPVAADVAAVTAAVAGLGYADAGPEVRALDAALAGTVDVQEGQPRRRLLARLRAARPDRPWVHGSAGLADTLPLWRDVAGDDIAVVLVHSRPPRAVAELARGGRRTEALALACWERSLRSLVEAAAGLPVLVTGAEPAPDELRAFLGGGSGAPNRAGSLRPCPVVTPAQARLDALLISRRGVHRPFRAQALPAESLTTDALVDAERCFERERAALEGALARSVAALEAATPAPPRAPWSFDQGYGPDASEDEDGYALWVERQRPPVPSAAGDAVAIGLVVVVPAGASADACAAWAVEQDHRAWELCLAPVGEAPVEHVAATDGRIRACPPASTSVAAANAAAATVQAPYLAFVDHRDRLADGALAAVAAALAADPEADLLYTDEDEIEDGRRSRPVFKPDWSPDLLLAADYVGRLLVVRRSLFEELGGLHEAAAGAEHYDLALRASERARRVAHLPVVAYHRAPRPRAEEPAERAVLRAAMARRGEQAVVEPGLVPGTHRVRRALRAEPLVSIIVPFRDGAGLLRRCVDSLDATAGYANWELVLIDNQSWEPETRALLDRVLRDPRCRLVSYDHPYNWSKLNNFGARHSRGDMLLFLNSDVEGRADGWLAAMVEHAQRPEVGAVGARLLYGDGSIQHGGVVMGLGGNVAWHAFWKCPEERSGYLGHARTIRNYSVVTGACMLVRRDAFDAVGGLDEDLAILFNDVELCLRMRDAGYVVVYTPFAELFHYESKTRGFTAEAPEVDLMRRRWSRLIDRDPYFNPNLDARRADFALPR